MFYGLILSIWVTAQFFISLIENLQINIRINTRCTGKIYLKTEQSKLILWFTSIYIYRKSKI